MNNIRFYIFVTLVAGFSSLNPVAIDIFLPAMPAIALSMAVEPGIVGMSIGIFTIGTAIGQIMFGPISDRFGRKPVVIFGLLLYIVAAIVAPYSSNIEILSSVRFIQGVGAASGRIIAVAIVRDLHTREEAAKLLSHIWMVSTFMPIVNPFIGSILVRYFDWSSVFICMAIFAGVIVVLTVLYFKETLIQKNLNALNPIQMLGNFKTIGTNRTFLIYMLIGSISVSSLYGFLANVADLLITQYKQSPTVFAGQFAIVMLGSLIGSYISGRLSIKLGINRVIKIGILITASASTAFLILTLSGIFTVAAVILPYTIQRVGEAMISAQTMAGSISPFPQNAGAASSALGFCRQMTGAMMAILVGYFADGTPIPMAIAMIFGGIVPAGIYFLFKPHIN